VFQHDFGPVDVGFDRVDRLLHDQLHADRGGQMKHHVAAIDELGEQRLVVHRVDEVLEACPPLEMRDVVDGPGRQVVEDEDLMAVLEQRLGQMRSDEARAAGD
jgi:hypothetical protein